MANIDLFTGLKIKGEIMTNGKALEYLRAVFDVTVRATAVAAGVDDDDDILFISEREARKAGEPFRAGEGRVRSLFDFNRGGLDHVVDDVLVVGFDEFFDDGKADEPVDAAHFFTVLAAIEHENQHLRQYAVLESGKTVLGKLFFLNQWGLHGSQSLERELYAVDVNEINAQYVAMDRLARHADRFGAVELVEMGRVPEGFEEGKSVKPGPFLRARDFVLPFYQDCRHEGVKEDFVPYPDGGYGTAGELLGAYRRSFVRAVLEPKAWDAKAVPGAHWYKDIDAYVADGELSDPKSGKRERIASMFAANPKLLDAYKLKADGYGQSVMLACVSTLGAGGKSLSDVLGRRIRDIYGVDVSVKAAFGPPGYAECLPGPLNPRYLMALRALGEMRSDAGRALEGVDFEL